MLTQSLLKRRQLAGLLCSLSLDLHLPAPPHPSPCHFQNHSICHFGCPVGSLAALGQHSCADLPFFILVADMGPLMVFGRHNVNFVTHIIWLSYGTVVVLICHSFVADVGSLINGTSTVQSY